MMKKYLWWMKLTENSNRALLVILLSATDTTKWVLGPRDSFKKEKVSCRFIFFFINFFSSGEILIVAFTTSEFNLRDGVFSQIGHT